MPLHKRSDVDDLTSTISRLSGEIHKYQFPSTASDRRMVFELVSEELALDGNAHQNLATFCQTWETDEVLRLMDLSINKNLIDKDEYPQAAEIESRCVHMLADLWNAPDDRTTRWAPRPSARRRPACSPAWPCTGGGGPSGGPRASPPTRPNLVCGPVQVVLAQVRPLLGHRDP